MATVTMEDCLQMLKDCEARAIRLSDWEKSFIGSLQKWLGWNPKLTKKQVETLDDIWERATADG